MELLMKTLIVEDDFTSRLLMQKMLAQFGAESHIAVNVKEALAAFRQALVEKSPYDLVCLDIMMPEMDGQTALREMRQVEMGYGVQAGDGAKIIMTSALRDPRNVATAYKEFCDAYVSKPIDRAQFADELRNLKLIP